MLARVHSHDVASKISRRIIELVLEFVLVSIEGVVAVSFLKALVEARRSELQFKLLGVI